MGTALDFQERDQNNIPTGKNFIVPFSNFTATVDPTVNDDDSRGYVPGSRWLNKVAKKEYICANSTVGAAVWKETTCCGGGLMVVRCATTTAGTFASDYDAGSSVDGITLATGDRILIKDQAPVPSSVGFLSPTSGTEDTSPGGQTWTNPGNITADDGVFAKALGDLISNTVSNYLFASGYDFSAIPDDATIVGIEIGWKYLGKIGLGTVSTAAIRVVKGGVVSATDLSAHPNWPTSATTETVGGSSNLCGETWAVSDIKASNFGSVIQATLPGPTACEADVDYSKIKVYFTLPEDDNNGVYVVQSSGVPVRAEDADTGLELVGALVMVKTGTVNAKTLWMNDQESITIGVTSVSFTKVSP